MVWLVRLMLAGVNALAVAVLSAGIAVGAFELQYANLIYPGVAVWGVDLSGMTREGTADTLSRAFDYPHTAVFAFRDGDRTWTATAAELGVTFDVQATAQAAFAYGRWGDLTLDLPAHYRAWHEGYAIAPVVIYDSSRAQAFLQQIAAEVFRPPVEASLRVAGADVEVIPGQVGRSLDVPATLALLEAPIRSLTTAEVPLAVNELTPAILDTTAQAEAARRILAAPLTLTVANAREDDPGPWTIDPPALAQMLIVRRVEDGPGRAHYEVGLDPDRLRAFLEPLAPQLFLEPLNARFTFQPEFNYLKLLESAQWGRALNIEATIREINEQTPQGVHIIPLVFDLTQPAVDDNATAEALGIAQQLSEETTWFKGSSQERVHNIKVAASQFHGALIAPGETFSFNQILGDVSLDTGYAEALIIYGGRTIRGVGGGVCQVSTTVFRAAFFAGFPIAERYSHAYRVSWYEKGFGPGLDATVYAPVADFKFINDLPNWILIESYVYEGSGRLVFRIYGTSDGREVKVSKPVIKNVVPHPEDLWEEDPELAPGEIKQVDWAADGADVTVTRTVTRQGEVLYEDVVETHYLPWRAVFQYGPGTEIPKDV